MATAKPDCTGQRFGSLIVLAKTDLFTEYGKNKVHHRLWRLQCDCGKTLEMTRSQFDTERSPKLCCGCNVRSRRLERAIRTTENLVGQIFGFLTVIGSTYEGSKDGRRLWILKCDCGKIINLGKAAFIRTNKEEAQKSCGCHRYDRLQVDITGQRFGLLVAVKRSRKNLEGKWLWDLRCDCGGTTEMRHSRLKAGYRLNCGDRVAHPGIGHRYPATPNPYPIEAGKLLTKYLRYTKTRCVRVNAEILDERMDRLIRACWILTYRRQQEEDFSELHERRYIFKYLRFASIRVLCRDRKLKYSGRVNTTPKERAMFTKRSPNYPVGESQTPGNTIASLGGQVDRQLVKRIKFRRR